ncbi:tyrosine-type recombinase/integrase [Parvularcula oceani]|uniref:tyrosine-type recombinase/integrase n=1 Tax=Parvularcula oceani TaxID=1247963 RepID=UPI0009DDAE5A|nr:site-specific integrase [Parvularcula oceani]
MAELPVRGAMAGRITKRAVDALPAGERRWDGELKGFGVQRTKGGTASYVLKFRAGGRQRWLTIGKHGSPWTPDTARKEAQALLALVAQGKDPATEKLAARDRATFAAFAERYLAEHAERHKKASSVRDDRANLRNHLLPAFGARALDQITRQDVAKLHSSLADRPVAANRVLALLSHIFTMAQAWGEVPDGTNPTRHIKKFKEVKRERYLSAEEFVRLGAALRQAEEQGSETPYAVALFRLLTFTAARCSEIRTARWEWVDLQAGELRLPDSKTGRKTIHLSPPALEVLAALPREEGNPFVICGGKPGASLVNYKDPWKRISEAARLDDVRPHDLRHSFASIAVAGGMSLPMIGALLGHTQAQTTARYAHLASDPLKAATAAVGTRINGLMEARLDATAMQLESWIHEAASR